MPEDRILPILVVDDEVDVCSQIVDELEDTHFYVVTATSYEYAQDLLESRDFAVAILDIMGVRGQDLLAEYGHKLPCIMLTANALSKEQLKASLTNRAALYLPKEELGRILNYLEAVVEEWEQRAPGKDDWVTRLWRRLFRTVHFKTFFGPGWWQGDEAFKRFETDLESGARGPA